MAKLHHLIITALKDTQIVTAVKRLKYADRVNGKADRPAGQEDYDVQTHGLSLVVDQTIEIDVKDDQLPNFQAAVNAGDLEIQGMPAIAAAAPVKGKETR